MARTVTSVLTPRSTKMVRTQLWRRVGELNSKRPKKEARVPIGEPLVKQKVEKRGKYLSAVVTAILNLREGKGSSKAAIIARMKVDFPELPWDNVSVTNKYVNIAFKSGLYRNILIQQGNGGYTLSETEIKNHPNKVACSKVKPQQQSIVSLLKNQTSGENFNHTEIINPKKLVTNFSDIEDKGYEEGAKLDDNRDMFNDLHEEPTELDEK